jgi:hypothetical protein
MSTLTTMTWMKTFWMKNFFKNLLQQFGNFDYEKKWNQRHIIKHIYLETFEKLLLDYITTINDRYVLISILR